MLTSKNNQYYNVFTLLNITPPFKSIQKPLFFLIFHNKQLCHKIQLPIYEYKIYLPRTTQTSIFDTLSKLKLFSYKRFH